MCASCAARPVASGDGLGEVRQMALHGAPVLVRALLGDKRHQLGLERGARADHIAQGQVRAHQQGHDRVGVGAGRGHRDLGPVALADVDRAPRRGASVWRRGPRFG